MGLFGFLKRRSEDEIPPDVGREPVLEDDDDDSVDNSMNEPEEDEEPVIRTKGKGKGKNKKISSQKSYENHDFEFQKLQARFESVSALIKGMNERFSSINQQIGELRAMDISNEKAISKLSVDSAKAVDIVKEVKPEKLRFEFQKVDMRVEELSQKLEANKQLMESAMKEVKDIRRQADFFVGADALLKLNEDTKKDLIATQQVASKSRMYSDKVEQIFVEMRKYYAENEKLLSSVSNLNSNFTEIKKEIEKLKLDFSNIAKKNELDDFKGYTENKLKSFEENLSKVNKIREENERLARLIETVASVSQENRREIEKLGLSAGDEGIKKAGNYESRLASILEVLDSLAEQISQIKHKIGMKETKKDKKETIENKENSDDVKNTRYIDHAEEAKEALKKLVKFGELEFEEGNIRGALGTYKDIKKMYDSFKISDKELHSSIMNLYHKISKKK